MTIEQIMAEMQQASRGFAAAGAAAKRAADALRAFSDAVDTRSLKGYSQSHLRKLLKAGIRQAAKVPGAVRDG